MDARPGEFELIAAIRERVEAAAGAGGSEVLLGSGDDAAVVAARGAVVTSVDAAVEGVHFERATFSPRAIGHKALAAGLSDLAAMGAVPGEAYVQLLLPDDVSPEACLELADGLAAVAAAHGVAIAGGDVTRSPVLALAITVNGRLADPDRAVRRSGAAPGEALVVTGELGGAAAGLLVLREPELARALDAEVADALRARQLTPRPRLEAGGGLARAGATAMIDLSDGLGADAGHVAAASGVAAQIELQRLPLQAGVEAVAEAAGIDRFELAAARGEDYELLAALPRARVESARREAAGAGVRLTEIGSIEDGAGVRLTGPDGALRRATGHDQLRPDGASSDRG